MIRTQDINIPGTEALGDEHRGALRAVMEACPIFADKFDEANDATRRLVALAFGLGYTEGTTDGLRSALETLARAGAR